MGGPVAVPREIDGIPIDRNARRRYFLQGTHFSADPGARIGAYVVHYRDGTRAEIPIRYNERPPSTVITCPVTKSVFAR